MRPTIASLVLCAALGAGMPPPPADAQTLVTPSARELSLIERAQSSGSVQDYLVYLREFPDGVFAELARIEVGAIEGQDPQNNAAENTALPAPPTNTPSQPPASMPSIVTFTAPLDGFSAEVDGRSIAQIIEGSPLFPPIEGLPDELWKDQTCSNCHSWTQEALCDQAQVYLGDLAAQSLAKQHPMGGGLKRAMQSWAVRDCP